MTTDVAEQEETATERKVLTAEQKQAATYRRDATLLRKYGNTQKADELEAKALELAPESTKNVRVDPMTVLTADEQHKLRLYFECSKNGFPKIAAVVSAKRLGELAQSI